MIGILYSSSKIIAPVKDPSPPMTIRESILFLIKFSKAFFLPALVLNSRDRADFKIVPPLLIILLTDLAFI